VLPERESVWLRQEKIAQLFGRERSVITKHLRNVFAEGELERDSVVAKNSATAADGKASGRYNLDAIISVGYRINFPPRHALSSCRAALPPRHRALHRRRDRTVRRRALRPAGGGAVALERAAGGEKEGQDVTAFTDSIVEDAALAASPCDTPLVE
jgi:hypothetical protein